jgi:hypothetical protein
MQHQNAFIRAPGDGLYCEGVLKHPQNVRFQNVRFNNVWFQNVLFQNVKFTKRQVYKTSGFVVSKRLVKTSIEIKALIRPVF